MRVCCCWSYQWWPTLRWSWWWMDPKSQIGPWAWWPRGSLWKKPLCGDKLILELSSFWSCHVWVTAATLHQLKWNQGGEGGKSFLPNCDPTEVREFCLNNVRGPVHTTWKVTIPPFSTVSVQPIPVSKDTVCGSMYSWNQCQVPIAYSGSTNGDLWRITSRVLQGTYLSVQLECPFYGNAHKDCACPGCPCQTGATGSPPDKDFQGIQWLTPKGMGLGGPGPPRPQIMAQTRAEAGQRIAAQMGTPVCTQQPGPGQNCSGQE